MSNTAEEGVDMLLSCCFKDKYEDPEQTRHSRRIDEILAKDKRYMRKEVKLLLLGAGESGKSTFLKQMKIIHGNSLVDDNNTLDQYKCIIYQNILKGMKVLIDARNKLNIDWGDDSCAKHALHVFAYENTPLTTQLFIEYSRSVKELWKDKGIQSAYDRRIEFQLSDGVRYLFDNINRIAVEGYTPTNQDILYSRKATKGITEYSVTINDVPFRFVDVGGQRSQRQKWFQCFESVTSILFMVSSSEYDQVLVEDRQTNRLRESQNIFETIANSRCFLEVSYILFLNKTDLLIEKIARATQYQTQLVANGSNSIHLNDKPSNNNSQTPNSDCQPTIDYFFPEFAGDPLNLDTVQNFILSMFESVRRDQRKQMYHHFTTAVDTENIKYVFNAVRNTILQKNITQLMLQ